MFKGMWLFRFNSYSYCQGTRDTHYGDMRLVILSLPCEKWEAQMYLKETLRNQRVEFDEDSIECLNVNITNS